MWKISQLLLLEEVTVIASHQCGPGSIPELGVMWVEFVVVVVLQGFFLQVLQFFLPPPKYHTFKFQFQTVEVKSHVSYW